MHIAMGGDDVSIVELERRWCDACEAVATHAVMFDVRVVGTSYTLGKYCEPCARATAEAIRASIPMGVIHANESDGA